MREVRVMGVVRGAPKVLRPGGVSTAACSVAPVVALACLLGMAACAPKSDFAALQARGASPQGMGVDQAASVHRFDDLPDGGRIEFLMRSPDSAAIAQIRTHLRHIAQAFGQGDFDIPMFVHDREVPGTPVMKAKRQEIRYRYAELPLGGEVRIHSADPEAIEAIHAFMAFQRSDHRAGGHH